MRELLIGDYEEGKAKPRIGRKQGRKGKGGGVARGVDKSRRMKRIAGL